MVNTPRVIYEESSSTSTANNSSTTIQVVNLNGQTVTVKSSCLERESELPVVNGQVSLTCDPEFANLIVYYLIHGNTSSKIFKLPLEEKIALFHYCKDELHLKNIKIFKVIIISDPNNNTSSKFTEQIVKENANLTFFEFKVIQPSDFYPELSQQFDMLIFDLIDGQPHLPITESTQNAETVVEFMKTKPVLFTHDVLGRTHGGLGYPSFLTVINFNNPSWQSVDHPQTFYRNQAHITDAHTNHPVFCKPNNLETNTIAFRFPQHPQPYKINNGLVLAEFKGTSVKTSYLTVFENAICRHAAIEAGHRATSEDEKKVITNLVYWLLRLSE